MIKKYLYSFNLKGYPEKFKKNILIQNLENLNSNNNQFIFHAGTKHVNNKFFLPVVGF